LLRPGEAQIAVAWKARGWGASQAAATLAARLDQTAVITAGERHLLKELLERIANGR
jgi:hypothetical protein